MSKCSRPLTLILTIILSFSFLSVNSFAADEENLIDPNFQNWQVLTGDINVADSTAVPGYQRIYFGTDSQIVLIYDLTELNLTDTYTLSFYLVDYITEQVFFENYSLDVGAVVFDSSGDYIVDSNQTYFTIDKNNYLNFTNSPFELTFKMNNYIGKPAISFVFTPNSDFEENASYPYTFYIKDVSLTSSGAENGKKLDGILGWLQDIFYKLGSIGDKLTDVWTNITSSVTALGDRISNFFGELGSKISTEFTALTSDFSGYISSLGDRISNYFTNLSVNISGFFTDLLEGIKDFFRGFGNLILYFNWEGEYTNPFDGRSIFGGSNSGDSSNNSNFENLIDISNFNFKGGSNFTVTSNSDGSYYFNLSGSSSNKSFTYGSGYFGSFLSGHTYRLSFKISNFSNSAYPQNNKVQITVKPSGSSNIIVFEVPYDSDGVVTYDFTYSYDYEIYLQFILGRSEFVLSDFTLYDITDFNIGDDTSTGSVDIQSSLDTVLEYFTTVTTDVENVMDSITGTIELFDEFCEEFPFIKALCIFTLFILVACVVVGL